MYNCSRSTKHSLEERNFWRHPLEMLPFVEKLHATSLQRSVTRNRSRQLRYIPHLPSNATTTGSFRLQVFWTTGRASVKQPTSTAVQEFARYEATHGGTEEHVSCCAPSYRRSPFSSRRLQVFWTTVVASAKHPTSTVLQKLARRDARHGGTGRHVSCCAPSSRNSACSRPANVVPCCTPVSVLGRVECISWTRKLLPFLEEVQRRRLLHGISVVRSTQQAHRVVVSSRKTNDGAGTRSLASRGQWRSTADASITSSGACMEDIRGAQVSASIQAHRSASMKTEKTSCLQPRITEGEPASKGLFRPIRITSYVPQQQHTEPTRGKKTSRGKPLFIFLLCSCFPVVLLAALFTSIVETRKAEQQFTQQALESEEDYLRAASDLVATTTLCYCLQTTESDGAVHNAVFVDPHLPEARLLRLPETAVVAGLKGNYLTDLILGEKSDYSLPFNFIHFALARSSPAAASIQDGKKMSLFYVHPRNGATLLLSGFAAVVLSKEQRRHYWRSRWEAALPGVDNEEYVLLKFVPDTLQLSFPPPLAPAEKYMWSSPILRRRVTDTEISWVLTPQGQVMHGDCEFHRTP